MTVSQTIPVVTAETKVALLDYDDTMAETERVALGAAYELTSEMFYEEANVRLTHSVDEHVANFPGVTYLEIAARLSKQLGCSFSEPVLKDWASREVDAVCAALAKNLKPMDGSIQMLELLQARNVCAAVVSSSATRRLKVCLEATKQRPFVPDSHIFSASDSMEKPRSKPDPAIYTFALEKLGFAAENAVAVEDSPSGVQSATNAGIACIGFTGALPLAKRAERAQILKESGAFVVVESLDQIGSFLREAQ